MQIFVMRHGQAEANAPSDAQRALSSTGVKEATRMGQWLAKSQDGFDCIYVSPYVRAQQTAAQVIQALPYQVNSVTLSFITPEDNARIVQDYLDGVCTEQAFNKILIVSHMPLVSYLVAQLTVDHAMPIFQTASVAQINYDASNMQGDLLQLTAPCDLN